MDETLIDKLNNSTSFEIPNINTIKENSYSELGKASGFNVNTWNEVISLQTEFNEKVITNWVNKKLDWKMAILIENAELMDSLNWPWWKVRKNDWLNFETEMIDIFCFLLGLLIEKKSTDMIIPFIASKELSFKNDKNIVNRNEELAQSILTKMSNDFMMSLVTGNTLTSIITWFDVWYSLGNNIETLFIQYKIKYCLNNFRQNHGYKEGTYQKIWHGEEDNVRAKELTIGLENDETFIDELYTKLEEFYGGVEDIVIKDIGTFINDNEKWNLFMVNIPESTRNIMLDFANEFNNYAKS